MPRPPGVLLSLLLTTAAFAQQQQTILVTNANDDGSGSFRAALEEANAVCNVQSVSCRIEFRIPDDGAAWQTIRPLRPLPFITTPRVFINGTTQIDTNPDGPDIELNGSLLRAGDGLVLASCGGIVSGLAINGFPGNGLVLGAGTCGSGGGTISKSYIGCDPTGTRAVPNYRGIVANTAKSLYYHWSVQENVISGNTRSGVFVESGPQKIERNIIGLTAKLDGPLSNGASGVAVMIDGSGTDINDNYIGFNRDFGVAIAHGAYKVAMHGNSFQANWQLAIDWGLDGVSPHEAVDIPEITSVHYESGVTTIEVRATGQLGYFPQVSFYANDVPDPSGYGEGQYFLGQMHPRSDGLFVLDYPGDLRGKWVTATVMRGDYYGFLRGPGVITNGEQNGFVTTTSEFSRAVEVK